MARVVLIDDELELREVMAEILAAGGHEVVTAADGDEGISAVRAGPTEVVLCDINMPGRDGFGVLAALRADAELAALPFIFLTSESQLRAGLLSGADDYLMKPVSSADLLAAIGARLKRRDALRKEADRRVGEVRRAVAALLPHELRTPLTTIMGSARLLQEFHGAFPPEEIEKMATGILKAAQRLHRMTENYILYADLETRRLSGGQGERLLGASGGVEVKAAAMEAAAQRERSGDLALDVAEVRVPVGPAYLRKAVTELVHNAFKFSPQDTPVLVSLACAGAEVLLKVADLGRGLDPEQLRSLGAFQQFDRGRFEQQGSGMGLTLVRGIAEATGGRFTISSRPGQGTTVSILWTASSG